MSLVSPERAASILSWLGSHAVDLSRITTFATRSAGTGIAATVTASAGDVLVSIPSTVWKPFSALDARESLSKSTIERVDAHAASLGGGSALADGSLLAARLLEQRESSPYLTALPMPDVPLLWPAQLRFALLRGTSAGPAAESQAALSEGICSVILDTAAGEQPPSDQLASFRWAQAILLSRAHSGEGKPLALVPGLDLLNHAGLEANAAVRFSPSDGAFELVATRRIESANEEVCIDYGSSASHRLLRLYGFLPEGGDEIVPGEEVLVPLLPSSAELQGAPEEVLEGMAAARDALARCGISSGTMKLVANDKGIVEMPSFVSESNGSAEAATARRVLRGAVEVQQQRQKEAAAACEAVGLLKGEAAATQRAKLCARLNANEARVLEQAAAVLNEF